jgi:hypothetical protein
MEEAPGILERVPKNPPAYGAWNGQTVVVGIGEALLGPALRGREARLPITVCALHTEDARAQRHRYVAETYDQGRTWFDFGPLGAALGHPVHPESPRGTNRYHRFDPNFAYRYRRVDTDETGLTLGKVVDLGVQYLELALAW